MLQLLTSYVHYLTIPQNVYYIVEIPAMSETDQRGRVNGKILSYGYITHLLKCHVAS